MKARMFLLLVAGAVFGLGLGFSGMADPARVIGFLDVAGHWDPTLVFVMAGALGTYGLGMLVWRRRTAGKGWFGCVLPSAGTQAIDRRLVLGSIVFGVGWGMSGFCPGPAIASLGALRMEALVFVPAMAVGMLIAQRFFGADSD
ncbi:MAG: hypothetical protein QM715_20625 [Nibricoccus sp.]